VREPAKLAHLLSDVVLYLTAADLLDGKRANVDACQTAYVYGPPIEGFYSVAELLQRRIAGPPER
jgi:hypothetical protein